MAAKKGKEKVTKTLFYYCLLRKECKAKDIASLSDLADEKKEVWIDSNICELILENDSLVFEDAGEDFSYSEDEAFLQEHGFQNLYAVTYADSDGSKAMAFLKELVTVYDGVLCSDTEDFQPVILGNL